MWNMIKKWFKDSETIFWAQLQVLLGIVGGVIVAVDPALVRDLVGPWVFVGYVALNGVVTQRLRMRRDPEMGAKPK